MQTNLDEFTRLTHLIISPQKNTPKEKAKIFADIFLSLDNKSTSEEIKKTIFNFLFKIDLKTIEQLSKNKAVSEKVSHYVFWEDVFNLHTFSHNNFYKLSLFLPKIALEKIIEAAASEKDLGKFSVLINYALKNGYCFEQKDWFMWEKQIVQYSNWEKDFSFVCLFLSSYFTNPKVNLSFIFNQEFKGFLYPIQLGNFSHEKVYLNGKKTMLSYELFNQFYDSFSTDELTLTPSKLDLANFIQAIQHKFKSSLMVELVSKIISHLDDKTKMQEVFELNKYKHLEAIFSPIIEQAILNEKINSNELKNSKKIKI